MEPNIAPNQPPPEPVQTPIEPISELTKKSFPKWLAIIIGVIVLIIVILIILFSPFFLLQIALNKLSSSKMAVNSVSPTPVVTIAPAEIDQNTSWKIYTDSSGYSFEYPPNWNEVTSIIPEDREFHSRDYSEHAYANILPVINKGMSLTIEAGIDPMFISYSDYKNYVEKINKSKPQEILVDNQKCLFYSNSGPILGTYVSECTMFLDRKKYHLAFENVTKDNSLFTQILSTFKFTGQTSQADPTATWRTYSNKSVGYSFKYPSDWYIYPPKKGSYLDFQTVSPASYSTRDIDGVPAGMYVDIWVDDAKDLSLENWAKDKLQIPVKLADKNIAGTIWKMTTDYPFYIGGNAFIIKQTDKTFLVSLTQAGLDKPGGLKISENTLETLLSTFKFSQ
jgi:hypothetical protein